MVATMSISEKIGGAAKLLVEVRDAELRVELVAALLDARSDALDLQEENAKLRKQIEAHDKTDAIDKQLYYARHAYWRKDESIDSAYCQACWDSKRMLIRLARIAKSHAARCKACNSAYDFVYSSARPNEGDHATAP